MSNYATEGTAIRTRFANNWSTTDIAGPNDGYTPTQGTAWVRLTIRDGDAVPRSLLGQRRATGVVLVEIYLPEETGDATARTYADSICNIFRRITVSGVRFGLRDRDVMAREAVTQEPGWYRWIVEIPFEADSNP